MNKHIQFLSLIPLVIPMFFTIGQANNQPQNKLLLAHRELPLENRHGNFGVNEVFKDNILLNLAYLDNRVPSLPVNWNEVTKPFDFEFVLNPNKTFAYHSDVLPKYEGKVEKTTNAHFNYVEGFKTSGYLYGDGVCHLASLLYWAAKDANLDAEAPTRHDFANIPDVPREFGASIYNSPGATYANGLQNLYITNNKGKPITFRFNYSDNKIKVSILETVSW